MDKVKLYKSAKEPEIYHYFNANKEKLWMFRHKYYDAVGKRREKKKSGFKTEKAALKALLEVKAATLRGEIKHIENDNLTVGQWLDIWYEANQKKWKIASQKQREMAIRLQMKPLIGHFKLQQLTKAIYQTHYINELEKKYKPSTVRLLHNLFKVAINAAVEEEILSRNKLQGAVLPSLRGKKADKNYLTPKQLNILLNHIKQHEDIAYYSLFLTIAYTGMRKGEALGLQWKNIDYSNQTITIERHRGNNGVDSTKTKNSERTIKIDEIVLQQLKSYRIAVKAFLLSHGRKLHDDISKDDSFIFISPKTAEPFFSTGLNGIFNRIVAAAGLPATTIHGLRHTHATILMNNDIPVKAIAERLGNTPEMIHTTYGHVLREMEDKIIDTFERAIENGAKSGASS
ncbi:tyrosine-type recombinase/integrase [Lysinibacillus xylanilyticus]|uniref:site-specific integrase n=1 Tax=Lysinibacillus xylanilyticus TaxID=582475 RepID=UPI003D075BB4